MNVVIAFVKEPTPGRVKTRLCPPLTHAQAAMLYSAFAQDVMTALGGIASAEIEVGYDARPDASGPSWLGPDVRWFPQHGADLGERMSNAFERAFARGARRVVVVGSDIPEFEAGLIDDAFEALRTRSLVLGPADDGGYCLIGLSAPCPELFRSISWSTSEALDQTLYRAGRLGLSQALLPSCRDVDTAEDLSALRLRLESNPSAAPQTRRVLTRLGLAVKGESR